MTASTDSRVINVQPHPRLLSILGDIEFAPWQCIAELVDNAFDEFLRQGDHVEEPTVWVSLPSRNSSARYGEVWIKDNGPGMTLEQLNGALRAGWTSNDRYGSLGLFGVGFNIATARLGHVAVVRTARSSEATWTVVTIDLRALAAGDHFDLPVTTEPKGAPDEHGTEIVIRQLKPEHHNTLSRQQVKIKTVLGDVYSHLLSDRGFRLIVDRERVKPRRPCVWAESRSVFRSGRRIPAIIPIDETLPDRRACLDCGHWEEAGSDDEACPACQSLRLAVLPRRIWGWVGVQRYLSPTDYGIDFIRNGRKILLRDDSLFRWVDPDDPTGRGEQEYPIEVPRAGRIVGEIHVDHVRVNYQKNAFEYETPEWKKVVRVLRGEGPLLPRRARALGYPENTSPLARLVSGYRRNDPGLSYLIPGDGRNALHERSREWADRFRKGDPEFQTDEKWYQAARQHDQPPEPPSDPPPEPGDILGAKGLLPGPGRIADPPAPPPVPETEEDRRERWRVAATHLPDLEGPFGLRGQGAALDVTTWLVNGHRLRRPDTPDRVPVYVAAGRGTAVEVFVDAEHPVFADFAVDTRDLVVIELAEFLRIRNSISDRALSSVFYDLKDQCLPDHKIAGSYLTETAGRLLRRIREGMQPVVAGNSSGYWSLVSPDDKSATEKRFALEGGHGSWDDLLSSGEWIDYTPGISLVRLVSARPEAFLDGRVFRSAHQSLTDTIARKVSAERIADLLGDVAVLADRPARRSPEELQRGRLSCSILQQELVTLNGDDQ